MQTIEAINVEESEFNKPNIQSVLRWRLILGKHADDKLPLEEEHSSPIEESQRGAEGESRKEGKQTRSGGQGISNERAQDLDETLGYLYDREYNPITDLDDLSVQSYQLMEDLWNYQLGKSGSTSGTQLLTIPLWVNKVRTLFPKEAQEVLTQDAIQRYEMTELLTDPDILEATEPSYEITKLLLSFREYLSPETLKIARQLIKVTLSELEEKFRRVVNSAIAGRRRRTSYSPAKVAKNFDFKRTIKHNLRYYQPDAQQIVLGRTFFNSRIHKKQEWHIIIVVDQSGSMLDSVIYSAVTASIFAGIRTLQTSLLVFDTEVVDLSDIAHDPVEVLMSVQLGGGTNIGKAMRKASQLVSRPDRTIIVLITDFYEGGSPTHLYSSVKGLQESGVQLLGLTAMNPEGEVDYSKSTAEQCVQLGMEVISATPAKLADMVANIVDRGG